MKRTAAHLQRFLGHLLVRNSPYIRRGPSFAGSISMTVGCPASSVALDLIRVHI